MEFVRQHLKFANVVSVLALFVALGGGAYAVQVAKKNSVTTKSIRNSTIRSVDVKNGQIRSADIGDGQVSGDDVADGSLTGSEVADGSLTAGDIDVNSLADATTGNTTTKFGACTQTGTEFINCLDKQVELDRPGKIYATADGSADSGSSAVPVGVNTCRLTVDDTPITGEFVIAADFSPGEAFSFSAVSETVGAGTHTVRFECKGNGTVPGPRVFFPTLTTLELGAG